MEELLKKAPLQSIRDDTHHRALIGNVEFIYSNGTVMTRPQWYSAMKREAPLLDRLTLEMAQHDRSALAPRECLPEWLIKAEYDSYKRQAVRGQQNEVV